LYVVRFGQQAPCAALLEQVKLVPQPGCRERADDGCGAAPSNEPRNAGRGAEDPEGPPVAAVRAFLFDRGDEPEVPEAIGDPGSSALLACGCRGSFE
jgi:hypothetical protein